MPVLIHPYGNRSASEFSCGIMSREIPLMSADLEQCARQYVRRCGPQLNYFFHPEDLPYGPSHFLVPSADIRTGDSVCKSQHINWLIQGFVSVRLAASDAGRGTAVNGRAGRCRSCYRRSRAWPAMRSFVSGTTRRLVRVGEASQEGQRCWRVEPVERPIAPGNAIWRLASSYWSAGPGPRPGGKASSTTAR